MIYYVFSYIHIFSYNTVAMFYYMLGNIHPKYRSSLHTIQLATVCNTGFLDQYSINEILKPFMRSIDQLESVCATVCCKIILIRLKFRLRCCVNF